MNLRPIPVTLKMLTLYLRYPDMCIVCSSKDLEGTGDDGSLLYCDDNVTPYIDHNHVFCHGCKSEWMDINHVPIKGGNYITVGVCDLKVISPNSKDFITTD